MGEPGLAPGLVQGVEGLAGGLVGLTRALLSGFERDLQGIGYCLGGLVAALDADRGQQGVRLEHYVSLVGVGEPALLAADEDGAVKRLGSLQRLGRGAWRRRGRDSWRRLRRSRDLRLPRPAARQRGQKPQRHK